MSASNIRAIVLHCHEDMQKGSLSKVLLLVVVIHSDMEIMSGLPRPRTTPAGMAGCKHHLTTTLRNTKAVAGHESRHVS